MLTSDARRTADQKRQLVHFPYVLQNLSSRDFETLLLVREVTENAIQQM